MNMSENQQRFLEIRKNLLNDFDKIYSDEDIMKMKFKSKQIVHFDFEGAPPKLDYLIYVIKLCKDLGVAGFLFKYEDISQWYDDLEIIPTENVYTPEGIRNLLRLAKDLNMFIIPIFQTFGHIEFVLKYKSFSHLRRYGNDIRTMCPINLVYLVLIKKMVFNVFELHSDSNGFHLGGDKVFNLGTCRKCKENTINKKLFITSPFDEGAKLC